MNEKDAKILASSKSASQKIKEITKQPSRNIIAKSGINQIQLAQAIKQKSKIDRLDSELKKEKKAYQPVHDELVKQAEQLKINANDTVEYVDGGMSLLLYPSNLQSGKFDEEQLKELLKSRNIYKKVFKPAMVLDEEALIEMLKKGKITPDELRAISLESYGSNLRIKLVDELEKVDGVTETKTSAAKTSRTKKKTSTVVSTDDSVGDI